MEPGIGMLSARACTWQEASREAPMLESSEPVWLVGKEEVSAWGRWPLHGAQQGHHSGHTSQMQGQRYREAGWLGEYESRQDIFGVARLTNLNANISC